MDRYLQDLRNAVRALLKNPAFSAIVIVALALGVGANTAIFSVVDNVLLRPLPYADPEGLVTLWGRALDLGYDEIGLSEGEFVEVARDSRTLQDVSAFVMDGATLAGTAEAEPERVLVAFATPSVFQTLKIEAALGRTFLPEEETEGRTQVAVLSNELWQSRFGGDPGILGKSFQMDGGTYQIVGVLPATASLPSVLDDAEGLDLVVPMAVNRQNPRWTSHNWSGIARLRPGTSLQQAQAEIATLATRMQKEHAMYYPPNVGLELLVDTLHRKVVGDVRTPLLILMGAVAVVLLIACANVANLLLARSEVRQREVAIRLALGARRGDLVRQFLTESLLYGLLGGGVGLLLAVWAVEALVASSPVEIPRLDTVSVDLRVLGFTLAVSVLAAVAAGLFPALQVSRENLSPLLKEEGRGSSTGVRGQAFRRGLVVAEVAMAVVLVIGSGLLIRSFVRMQQVDLGFDSGQVITMQASLPASKYDTSARARAFFNQAAERMASLQGVRSASVSNVIPFGPGSWDTIFDVEGKPSALENPAAFGDNFPNANFKIVTPGYFENLRIPVQSGRTFQRTDHESAGGVIIVNETLAKRFWPGRNALGQRMRLYASESEKGPWLTIVGIIGDVKDADVKEEIKPEMYIPLAQMEASWSPGPLRDMTLALRLDGDADEDPEVAAAVVRQALREMEPGLALWGISTVDDLIGEQVAQPRFNTLLISAFAALALALAMIGVYGVMSYTVARRSHEMGIRFALGAGAWDVLGMVVRQGMVLALAGLVLGLAAALAATRVLMSLLFGVAPFDVMVYSQVAAVLAAVALLACYIPARRAARVDPMTALKPY